MTFLLVSGLPGAGKSTFCHWLSQTHGYYHFDVDCETALGNPVARLLSDPRPGSLQDLVRQLSEGHERVAFDWGFPSELIVRVRVLRHLGADLWWFGGDEEAAIRSFEARRTVGMATLAAQLRGIHQYWPRIEKLFQGRMLQAILPGPTYMPSEELFRAMGEPGKQD